MVHESDVAYSRGDATVSVFHPHQLSHRLSVGSLCIISMTDVKKMLKKSSTALIL